MKTQTLSEEIQNPLNIFGRTRPKAYFYTGKKIAAKFIILKIAIYLMEEYLGSWYPSYQVGPRKFLDNVFLCFMLGL